MANKKPLTISTLVSTLKKLGIVTKTDLKSSLEGLERRLVRRMNKQKREIMTAMAKLALNSPSRKEFDELKTQVNPLN